MWVPTADLPKSAGHPFYERLNRVLDDAGFDAFVEAQCASFYADGVGRPSLAPGRYFRLLLLGYFEGLDSERAIAWRAADSLSIRTFLDFALHEAPPDHSTLSRTRRLIDLETHQAVFTWVLQRLVKGGTKLDQMAEENQTTWPLGRVSENGCAAGFRSVRARLRACPASAPARPHSQPRAKGGVRMVERQRRGGRACCVRDDSCRRSAPGCGRDESADRAARQSAVRSRRSRSIR